MPEIAALWKRAGEKGLWNLTTQEQFWVPLQPYLLSQGYQLRPRYTPGWKPVWIGTDIDPGVFEESVVSMLPRVIDAKRVADGTTVAIKWVPHAEDTRDELSVMQFLSSEPLRSDPANHCNPVLGTLPHPTDPNGIFIITPWLANFTQVPLATVGEVVDMLVQLAEGLAFMHRHNVAHRDCTGFNIMQDVKACFPPGIKTHPMRPSDSEDMQTSLDPKANAPRRYWFIDFGTSSRFHGPGPHLVTGVICRDQTAPELSPTVPYDPFKLDVYLLGNHFLEKYLDRYSNLEFLRPLLSEMTRAKPSERPTAQQVLEAAKAISQTTFGFQNRWRLRSRGDNWADVLVEDGGSLVRELAFQARGLLA
ncbi:hypothetical protein AURDEDRAFT_101416 [Auricularia subglabra TFB-10046 SS5]|nr:hypothetical protein AURDEDRAFT_101416 [Auricularia subglabra TFB-10046 SS5]